MIFVHLCSCSRPKSDNSSSLIQPFRDSLTGLSVGFPALDIERTMFVSLISSLYAIDAYIHGSVTEAAPKVFLKYFYVNTKTGEKSGEMLATVKLM